MYLDICITFYFYNNLSWHAPGIGPFLLVFLDLLLIRKHIGIVYFVISVAYMRCCLMTMLGHGRECFELKLVKKS
jgi:hypothetical protein